VFAGFGGKGRSVPSLSHPFFVFNAGDKNKLTHWVWNARWSLLDRLTASRRRWRMQAASPAARRLNEYVHCAKTHDIFQL